MCPACIAAAAWVVGGAVSTGGAGALLVSKLRAKTTNSKSKKKIDSNKEK